MLYRSNFLTSFTWYPFWHQEARLLDVNSPLRTHGVHEDGLQRLVKTSSFGGACELISTPSRTLHLFFSQLFILLRIDANSKRAGQMELRL
jgi:hypothetical protein